MLVRTPRALVVLALGLVAVGGFVRLLTWAMDTQSYNTWGALFMVPVVVALNVVVMLGVARRETDATITALVAFGFVAKMVGVVVRYFTAYVVYGGASDAQGYNLYAAEHYFNWRRGIFVYEPSGKTGTQNLELITTAIYTVIGPSTTTGFVVFGSLAFWGAYLLLRAFRVAFPDGNHRRYALLVLLLPSLLYWPSSIGKEAWLFLFVGVAALGGARYFRGQVIVGLALVALGAVGTALIRPHVTVLMVAALFVAQLARPTGHASTSLLTKAAGVVVMGVAAAILVTQSAQFLGIDDLSWQAVTDEITWAGGQTTQGGSAFTPVPLTEPLGVPAAIVTLLYRPFPWEAHNVQLLVQSVEGVLLLLLTIAAWPRLRRLPGLLRTNPYVVFALVYTLGFIVAFAGFANFGILARQRVLMLPFFLVLLALPTPAPRAVGRRPRSREYSYAQPW